MPTTKPAKMSAEELEAVRERSAAKPPSAFAEDEFELVLREGARLRALIADVPALLAHIAALEAENEALCVDGNPIAHDHVNAACGALLEAGREIGELENTLDATPNGKGWCHCGDICDAECGPCASMKED